MDWLRKGLIIAVVSAWCLGLSATPSVAISNCCVANPVPGCDDATCETTVCAVDPFCCDVAWDGICAGEAATLCAVCGASDCGNGILDAGEECDDGNTDDGDCCSATCQLVTCRGQVATLCGTAGNDVLIADADGGVDVIVGLGGDDYIHGKDGDDFLCGGDGNDELRGDKGNDELDGGPDQDKLVAGAGMDFLDGGPGTDILKGENGRDTCVNGEKVEGCEQ